MRGTLLLGAALAAGSSAAPGEVAPPRPTAAKATPGPLLSQCPRLKPEETADRARTLPLAIPAALSHVARANLNHIAVGTFTGTTLCVSTAGMEGADLFRLSRDGRFFSFRWSGNEAGGHMLVDRTGRGQAIDVGAAPVFSPSRQRIASVEISESMFGSLNGFLVLQVLPSGLRQLAKLENIPIHADWRIDSWAGENCINLSAVPQSRVPENWSDMPKARRDRYVARPGAKGWTLVPAQGRGCPAA